MVVVVRAFACVPQFHAVHFAWAKSLRFIRWSQVKRFISSACQSVTAGRHRTLYAEYRSGLNIKTGASNVGASVLVHTIDGRRRQRQRCAHSNITMHEHISYIDVCWCCCWFRVCAVCCVMALWCGTTQSRHAHSSMLHKMCIVYNQESHI